MRCQANMRRSMNWSYVSKVRRLTAFFGVSDQYEISRGRSQDLGAGFLELDAPCNDERGNKGSPASANVKARFMPALVPALTVTCVIIGSLLRCHTAFCEPPDPFAADRERMVLSHLKGRDITNPKVLEVMGTVKRHLFVSPDLAGQAYADHPLPIGEGQTISQPYVVALMTQILDVKPSEKVLEIGTGSGYQAAVLTYFTDQVWSIEIRKSLAASSLERLKALGYDHVRVKDGDGYYGWPQYAPFDAVMVTAAANHVPPPLLEQLKMGGHLLIPLGSTTYYQTLTKVTKTPQGNKVEHLLGVVFVPMVGKALSE